MHKVEMRHQENGEAEEELVVSNLRPFTLKARVPSAAAHRLRTLSRCPPPAHRAMRAHPVDAPVRPSVCTPCEQSLYPPCEPTLLTLAQVGVHDALDMPILDCALP